MHIADSPNEAADHAATIAIPRNRTRGPRAVKRGDLPAGNAGFGVLAQEHGITP